MTVTLTANYKETLKPETVEFIDGLLEDNYALDDILEFIDENSEEDFVTYYEEYVEQGEKVGYEVVDSFISEFGINNVEHCEEAFQGCYDSEAEFAEEFYTEQYSIPDELVIDWQATWDSMLRFDFTLVSDNCRGSFVFNSNF
mgnify:CR=1 FL=1